MTDYELSYVARRKPAKKATRKRPEAKVAEKVGELLTLLGFVWFRTNAGHWVTAEGHHIHGVPTGYADIHGCSPHGCFLACETKAPKNGLSKEQKEYRALVEAKGGTYIAPHSRDEAYAQLSRAYGPQRVAQWENDGRERKAAKKAEIDALKKKMGQLK